MGAARLEMSVANANSMHVLVSRRTVVGDLKRESVRARACAVRSSLLVSMVYTVFLGLLTLQQLLVSLSWHVVSDRPCNVRREGG